MLQSSIVQSGKKSSIWGREESWGMWLLPASHGHFHHPALHPPSKAPVSKAAKSSAPSSQPCHRGTASFSRRPLLAENSKLGQTRNEGRSHRQHKTPEDPALNPYWVLVKQRQLCARRVIVLRLGAECPTSSSPFFFPSQTSY